MRTDPRLPSQLTPAHPYGEEHADKSTDRDEIPEGLSRLVRALNARYDTFVDDVRHLIAVFEGIERSLVPKEFRG